MTIAIQNASTMIDSLQYLIMIKNLVKIITNSARTQHQRHIITTIRMQFSGTLKTSEEINHIDQTSIDNHDRKMIQTKNNLPGRNKTHHNGNEMQKTVKQQLVKQNLSSYQKLSNEGRRIELALFKDFLMPSFISKKIEDLPYCKKIKQFNKALTNGGQNFEEFPLIKLLNIALKYVDQGKFAIEIWKKLQFFIRNRLHRCTIEQNMRLLYIMLKTYPIYRFNSDFIFSICLGLKKQLNLMNDEQLKTLFWVLAINKNDPKCYKNTILIDLQTLLLLRVVQKAQYKLQLSELQRRLLPIQHLYLWIVFSLSLCHRNNFQTLVIEEKAIRLIKQFNSRWEHLVKNQQKVKTPSKKDVLLTFEQLQMYNDVIKYWIQVPQAYKKEAPPNFIEQFQKLKDNIVWHCKPAVSSILEKGDDEQKLNIFTCLLKMYKIDFVQNALDITLDQVLQKDVTAQQNKIKYQNPRIKKLLSEVMKIEDKCQSIVSQKIKILTILFDSNVIDFQTTKTYYHSLNLNQIQLNSIDKSLGLTYDLIKMQLYLFTNQNVFAPRIEAVDLILNFIELHNSTYRHFDWHSFNFIKLLIQKDNPNHLQILKIGHQLPNIQHSQQLSNPSQKVLKVFKKIVQQVKYFNTSRLVEEERQSLKIKQQIKDISKFFTEIRVHEMQPFEDILEPFNRLAHFANKNEKIVVNAYNTEQLTTQHVKLEKKLMNLMNWKVININSSNFMNLGQNQRIKFIGINLNKQQQLLTELKITKLSDILPLLK